MLHAAICQTLPIVKMFQERIRQTLTRTLTTSNFPDIRYWNLDYELHLTAARRFPKERLSISLNHHHGRVIVLAVVRGTCYQVCG